MRALVFMAGLLPESWLQGVSSFIAFFLFSFTGYRRKVIRDNLKGCFPELSTPERRRLARNVGAHLVRTLIEFLRLPILVRANFQDSFEVKGLEHYRAAKSRGKGVLAVSGHLGSWELVLAAIARSLPDEVVHVVVKPFPPGIDEVLTELRKSADLRIIPAKDGLTLILEALRKNQVVVFVLDQNATRSQGVFVPFFGRPASTMSALGAIALRTGAAVLPCAGHRAPGGGHVLELFPVLEVDKSSGRREALLRVTAAATAFIEERIRAHPEQWLWTHKRWRTQAKPEEPPA